jgi:hypothetical protein
MAQVKIEPELFKEIEKTFKGEAQEVIDLLESLETNPNKGKLLAQIGSIQIKELRYKSFRFYFIVDGYLLKILDERGLLNLLIKFLSMSNKKDQQEKIDKIKDFLRTFGKESLNKNP